MLKKLYKNSESENNQKKRKLRPGCSKAKKKKEKKSKNLQAQFFSSQINRIGLILKSVSSLIQQFLHSLRKVLNYIMLFRKTTSSHNYEWNK